MTRFLAYNLGEFRFGTILLANGDVDGRSGLCAIEAAAFHRKFVVGTVVSRALAYCRWGAEWELVAGASSVEDSFFGLCHRFLRRILGQFLDSPFLIAVLFQESVEFFAG